jgi:hypothetical protein
MDTFINNITTTLPATTSNAINNLKSPIHNFTQGLKSSLPEQYHPLQNSASNLESYYLIDGKPSSGVAPRLPVPSDTISDINKSRSESAILSGVLPSDNQEFVTKLVY